MKRLFLFLGLAAALLFVSTSQSATDAITEMKVLTDAGMQVSSAAAYDTLKAANDTITLFTKKVIPQGYLSYYVRLSRRTGTSKDTAVFTTVVDGYTSSDSLIGRWAGTDTITDNSEAKLLQLPLYNNTNIASKWTVKIHGAHGASTDASETIFNLIDIVGTRPVTIMKNTR